MEGMNKKRGRWIMMMIMVSMWASCSCVMRADGRTHTRSSASAPGVLQRLPLVNIAPQGWLKERLKMQEEGLAGHLSRFWPDVMNSTFIGGNATEQGGMHERAGYWLNGAVPLAFLLTHDDREGDEMTVDEAKYAHTVWPSCEGGHMMNFNETGKFRLTEEVGCYLKYILENQAEEGWYGGAASYPGGRPDGNGYWLQWNIVRSLIMYSEGNVDARTEIAASISKWLHYTSELLETVPLAWWSQVRWQDFSDVLLDAGTFLAGVTGSMESSDPSLAFRTAQIVEKQGFDWYRYYANPAPPQPDHVPWDKKSFPTGAVPYWDYDWHGVNNAMAIKAGAISYVLSNGDASYRNQTKSMLEVIDRYHGRPDGAFNADECFGGRGPERGVELCAIVETMYSLQVAFRIHHDIAFLDRIELLMHSSLPGALTNNLWAHNYISQSNEICSGNLHAAPWVTTGYNSNMYGLSPNYGCCTSNFIQGLSKFAMSTIAVSQSPFQQVYIALYAPLFATMPPYIGAGATFNITTNYPMSDLVTIIVDSKDEGVTTFLRMPSWVKYGIVTVVTYSTGNGKSDYSTDQIMGKPGTYVKVEVTKGQTEISIRFNQSLYAIKGVGYSNAASVYYGPLLLAMPLIEQATILNTYAFKSKDYQMETKSVWNKYIIFDESFGEENEDSSSLHYLDTSALVKDRLKKDDDMCSLSLTLRGGLVQNWTSIDYNEIIGPLPQSPLDDPLCSHADDQITNVTLVPYGCTVLRIASFPWAKLDGISQMTDAQLPRCKTYQV